MSEHKMQVIIKSYDKTIVRKEVPEVEGKQLAEQLEKGQRLQIDKPNQPIIPQFVADWFEKQDLSDDDFISDLFEDVLNDRSIEGREAVEEWFEDDHKAIFKLVRMIDGYEVEKEQRFLMPVPYQKSDQVYYCGTGDNITTKWSTDSYWHHQYKQEELDKYFPEIKHMAIEVEDE